MKVDVNTVVTFHYTLTDEAGTELESSRGGEPSAYLHGSDGIIKGLESALEGGQAGESLTVTLAPEQAYGQREPDQIRRVPVKHLIFKGKLRSGMTVQLNTSEGRQPVTIHKAGRHSADIDTNHPLAGRTLRFDVEIASVRAATSEEISHGHAHGVGGHQH